MSKKSKKNEKNYLDFIPVKNPDIEYETDENGIVTVFIEWKGFYHKIAQKIFRRPRVSDIKMDKYGSFVWHAIDDEKDVHQLSKEMESERQQPDLLERRGEKIMLKYIPYVLMFAVATMIIYGWGLWRTMHQKQDLSNMLCSKGISKVKKALKKNKSLTKKELEPFVKDLTAKQPFNSERIGVTDPNAFLDSILPYMLKQKMIKEIREDKKVVYQLNK